MGDPENPLSKFRLPRSALEMSSGGDAPLVEVADPMPVKGYFGESGSTPMTSFFSSFNVAMQASNAKLSAKSKGV
jgi:hypothetical protein